MSSLTLLNTAILTQPGEYRMTPISLQTAKHLIAGNGFESAVGHQTTADLLTELLGIFCPVQRVEDRQQPGDRAIVFRLRQRLPEGIVLSDRTQIAEIGYDLALLERLK